MRLAYVLETIFWGVLLSVLFYNQYNDFNGVFANADNYMQAVHIKDFSITTWSDMVILASNSPFGENIWQTRLLDVVWHLIDAVFVGFSDSSQHLIYSGFFMVPLAVLLMLITFIIGTRSILSTVTRSAVLLMLILQKQIYPEFSLSENISITYLTLFMVAISVCWWHFVLHKDKNFMTTASVMAAMAIWLSPAGFVLAEVFYIALLIAWIACRLESVRVTMYAWWLAAGTTVFWLINLPEEGFSAILLMRLSLFHVEMVWTTWLIALIVYYIPLPTTKGRVWTAIIEIILLSGAAFAFAGMDRLAQLPMIPSDGLTQVLTERFIKNGANIVYFIYPSVAIILGAILLVNNRYRGTAIIGLAFCLASAGATLLNAQFAGMAAVASTLLITLTLQSWYEGEDRIAKVKFFGTATVCILLNAGVWFLPLFQTSAAPQVQITKKDILHINMLTYLQSGTVFSDTFYGPAILWYTHHRVIGTPNYSNREAVLNTDKIWKTTDMKELAALIQKYSIEYIFLPEDYDQNYFPDPKNNTDKLYGQIITGENLPRWLVAIEKQADNPYNYYLYRVVRKVRRTQ